MDIGNGRHADRLTLTSGEEEKLTRGEKAIMWTFIVGFFVLVAVCCAAGAVAGVLVSD